MNKERQTMKAIALTLCLCLLLGVFAFGNPQAVYGWAPSQQEQKMNLKEIKSEATVSSSWDQDGKYDQSFYNEIKKNYATSYGSKDKPLQIENASQLAAFAKVVNETGPSTYNFQGKYVELANNIELNGDKFSIERFNSHDSEYEIKISGACNNVWQPIGIDPDHPFRGTFDGKDHEIRGMVVLNELTKANVYSGFFGVLANGGTIQNLRIPGGDVLSAVNYDSVEKQDFSTYAGGLVGKNNGSITKSYSTGDVASITKRVRTTFAPYTSAYAGALVGWNGKTGSITESYSEGTAMSYSFSTYTNISGAGGMVGKNSGKITASHSTGYVLTCGDAPNQAGGLVGQNDKGAEIETSYSMGAMIASYNRNQLKSNAGGLVGENQGKITASYSTGGVKSSAIKNSTHAGGLVGWNGDQGSITESWSTGATTSVSASIQGDTNPAFAGGLAGWNEGVITASYSTGDVKSSAKTSSAYAGGLVGKNGNKGSITESYTTGTVGSAVNVDASSPVFAGGLMGENDQNAGLVENNYWDKTVKPTISGGSKQNIEDAGTPLDPRKMTGMGPGRAETTMDGLDGGTWEFQKDDAITGPDSAGRYSQTWYYPRLTAITYTDSRQKPKYIKIGPRLFDYISNLEITGTPKAGEKLTAETEGGSLGDLQYQWYVEGIGNCGTSQTYTVEERDAGKKVIATAYKEGWVGTLEASVKISCFVKINNPAESHIRWISGSESQSGITGAMEEVVYEAEPGYYFPTNYSVNPESGVQVRRDSYTQITVSGTPTANATLTLKPAARKAEQSAPPGISDGVDKIKGTDKNMEYADSPDALNWITCNEEVTTVAPGTWYVRYKETDTQKASSAVAVTVTTTYQVEITNPSGSHITRSSGAEKQTVNSARAMEPVVYEAERGYYFPEDYSISPENGVQVKRDSYTQITVSGKPTSSASLTLKTAAVAKITVAPIAPKTPKIKATTTYNSARISWKKVSGAAGYQVYRAGSKNGKYKNVKTTGKASWTNKKLTTGKAYYYKVRTYRKSGGKTLYSNFSNKVKAVPRTKAPNFKLAAGKNKIRVFWSKVKGADGYRIYRAKSKKGKYKMIKDSRSKARCYTSIRLTDQHRYYYKMRSYKIVKGKKIYSTYSVVKSKRTR